VRAFFKAAVGFVCVVIAMGSSCFRCVSVREVNTTVTTVTFNYSSGLNVNRTFVRPDLSLFFVVRILRLCGTFKFLVCFVSG
jgi:hypothetical protein